MSVVLTEADLHDAVEAYRDRDGFAFDVETKGPVRLDPRRNEVFWIVLAAAGLTHVIPMGHPNGAKVGDRKDPRRCADDKVRNYTVPVFGPPPRQLRAGEVFQALEPLFYSDRLKVGHNLKFDLSSVQKYYDGRPIPPPFADTMVAAFLLDENQRPNPGGNKPYSLGACVHREFGFTYDKKIGAQVEAHPFQAAAKYAHHDGRWTWLLWRRLLDGIRAQKLSGIWNLEMDVLQALVAMESAGAPVDEVALRHLDVDLRRQLDELEGRLYGLAGRQFNLNSHAQKVQAFYTDQKLRPRKITKGGLPSCDEDALSYYRDRNKLIDTFLTFTEVAKLHSTYVNAYIGGESRAGTTKRKAAPHVGIVKGRIHANFKQNGAATGRFSSSEPNLQNVPRPDTDLGKLIRGVFVAPPGDVLIVADWSQVEYRLLAQQSGDARLIQAFIDGKDLHQANADDLGVSRSVAKNCNFACVPMDTEALTPRGWKHHWELDVGDLVLGSSAGESGWVPILEIVSYAQAPLVRVSSGHWSAVTTPNHRWLTQRRTGRGLTRRLVTEYATTEQINSEHTIIVSAPAVFPCQLPISSMEAAVIAWLHTDGSVNRGRWVGAHSQAGGQKVAFQGLIFQKKPDGIDLVDDLLLGVPHRRSVRSSGIVVWSIAPDWLRELWKRAGLDDMTLEQFVLQLGAAERRAFLDASFAAEGWTDRQGVRLLGQNEGPTHDALLIAAFLEGYDVSSHVSDQRGNRPYRTLRLMSPRVGAQRLHREASSGGPVWCIRTPTENWVMRQNGRVMLTGNTVYGAAAGRVAAMSKVDLKVAEKALAKHRQLYPDVYRWRDQVVRQARRRKPPHVRTLLGRRRRLPALLAMDERVRSAAERQAVNCVIQGCLPADTRVLTREGWVPIGVFRDSDEVWTGAEWAPAVLLSRGTAPRLRLWLSDGRTFDCDDRHQLLVQDGPWPSWRNVEKIGDAPLVRDDGVDWGVKDGDVEEWYWAGRMLGNGSLGKLQWTLAFSTGSTRKVNDYEEFLSFLRRRVNDFVGATNSKTGFTVHRLPSGEVRSVSGGTSVGREYWVSLGMVLGAGARQKRIPAVVFTLDRERRAAYLQGYFDADGHERERSRKITSVSRVLLADTLRLMQTLGMSGAIGSRMLNGIGVGWYDLYFHQAPRSLRIERIERLPAEPMYTLSVDHPRHAFSSEGLISKNSAADLVKFAMVRLHALLLEEMQLILTVHDELVVLCPEELAEEGTALVREAMEGPGIASLLDPVPLVADVHVVKKWSDAKI